MFRKPLCRRDFLKCLDMNSSPHFRPRVPHGRAQWNERANLAARSFCRFLAMGISRGTSHAHPHEGGARLSKGLGLHFEGFFRLNCQADRNIARAIERLKDMIAEQAAELALGAGAGSQFDAAITGMAVRTGNVGLFHLVIMPRVRTAFQSRAEHKRFNLGTVIGCCDTNRADQSSSTT